MTDQPNNVKTRQINPMSDKTKQKITSQYLSQSKERRHNHTKNDDDKVQIGPFANDYG
jgi:hypothetical protein